MFNSALRSIVPHSTPECNLSRYGGLVFNHDVNPTPQTDQAAPNAFGAALAEGIAMAERQRDGRIIVRGLPIFSEVRETDPGAQMGARETRDLAWLERALEKHKARRVLGQKPPMTLRHVFDSPERVGEYELTHIDLVNVNPDEPARFTVFGTKIYTSLECFEKAKDYDFRSAEISPEKPDELSTLALLRDKSPFFTYSNTVERLAPECAQAFEAFRSKGGTAPQTWRGRVEAFDASPSYRSEPTKEGSMPAVDNKQDEKKAPSVEERMEAMAAKFFETMSKKFEAMMTGMKEGKDEKPDAAETAVDDTKKAGGTEEPKSPKTEAAQASSPNDMLPPAVSELKIGELFSAAQMRTTAAAKNGSLKASESSVPEQFAARLGTLETANLGLKAKLEEMQREKEAVALVASAKKLLADMGVPGVSEAFELALNSAAIKGGKAGVDSLIENVKLGMGIASRAPETFGVAAQFGSRAAAGENPDLKKAIEAFGAAPDTRQKIHEFFGGYNEMPEHFRRSASFFDVCAGNPVINPSCMDDRGGLARGGHQRKA
jgi:hypothetical protein